MLNFHWIKQTKTIRLYFRFILYFSTLSILRNYNSIEYRIYVMICRTMTSYLSTFMKNHINRKNHYYMINVSYSFTALRTTLLYELVHLLPHERYQILSSYAKNTWISRYVKVRESVVYCDGANFLTYISLPVTETMANY